MTAQAVRAKMPKPGDCRCEIEARASAYLAQTYAQVLPFYRLEKAGAFMGPDPRGVAFATERVAAGAAELRDLIVAAWNASASGSVGYPATPVAEIEAGQADVYTLLYGDD